MYFGFRFAIEINKKNAKAISYAVYWFVNAKCQMFLFLLLNCRLQNMQFVFFVLKVL